LLEEKPMESPTPLSITVEPLEEASLIRAAGEIDLTTIGALRAELESAREDAATALLDLSDVTFIDSTGLHLLLETSRDAAATDWPFFIVRPSPVVQRLIEVSGTADLLALVDRTPERILN
jgi:anti-anti-sigma factor